MNVTMTFVLCGNSCWNWLVDGVPVEEIVGYLIYNEMVGPKYRNIKYDNLFETINIIVGDNI